MMTGGIGQRRRVFLLLGACALMASPACNSTAPSAQPSPHPVLNLVAPEDVAIDHSGRVYFTDYGGNRVFQFLPDGSVHVVAGTGTSGETGDGGPAVEATMLGPAGLTFNRAGDLLIAEHDGGRIRRVDAQGIITTFAILSPLPAQGEHPFSYPVGLAAASDGSVWVGEEGDGWVRSVDDAGITAGFFVQPIPGEAFRPGYLALDMAGNLYVADRATVQRTGCRIVRFGRDPPQVIAGTGQCGYSGDGGPATAAQLDDPNDLAFDAAGNLYVADSNNERIRRIDKHGIITTVAGTGVAGTFGDGGPATKARWRVHSGLRLLAAACSTPPRVLARGFGF